MARDGRPDLGPYPFLEVVSALRKSVVIGDGAGFHHRDAGEGLPENVRLITLPPYSPELNPVEKLWNLMKDALCNRCFESLDECDATITEFLRSFWEDARKVYSLIGDGYLPSKLNAI